MSQRPAHTQPSEGQSIAHALNLSVRPLPYADPCTLHARYSAQEALWRGLQTPQGRAHTIAFRSAIRTGRDKQHATTQLLRTLDREMPDGWEVCFGDRFKGTDHR